MIKVIKKLTGREGLFHRLPGWVKDDVIKNGGWLVHFDEERYLYFYDDSGSMLNLSFEMSHADVEDALEEDIEIIKNWELKQQLTPNTLKTFNELIDEL
jgi:hypothetical protein